MSPISVAAAHNIVTTHHAEQRAIAARRRLAAPESVATEPRRPRRWLTLGFTRVRPAALHAA